METSKISMRKNIFFNVIKSTSSLIFPLISFAYISRILGADGIGKINFSKVIIEYFSIVAAIGIRGYGIREGAKIRDDKEKLSAFVKEILIINLCAVVISYVFLFISIITIEKFMEYKVCILIQSGVIIFNQIGCEWFYEAIEKYPYISIRNIIFRAISLVLTFLFVKDVGDYTKYILIWTLCECGNGILNFVFLNKYIYLFKKFQYKLKRHISGILSLFVFTLSNNLYSNIDIIMLGFMKASYQVGIYSVAIKIIKISTTLITSVGMVFMPRIAYYISNKMDEKIDAIVYKVIDFMVMFSVPMVVGIIMLREEIITIFCGKDYINASFALTILAYIGIITPIYTFINSCIFIPLKKEKYMYLATCVALGSNILLNIILIPNWDINGAAVATLIAEFLGATVAIYQASQLVCFKGVCKNMKFYFLAVIPEFLGIKCVFIITQNELLRLAFSILGSVLIYFLALYLLKKELILEKLNKEFDRV